MFNKHAKPPTQADIRRFEKLREIGCIACLIGADQWTGYEQCGPTEIHHQLRAGKRIGHTATIPLGNWHHQGVSDGETNEYMLDAYGPSYHKHRRAFTAVYGSDEELLAKVNKLIEGMP